MEYKLICLDMDGTLLTTDKSLSKRVIDAIHKAHNKGVKIVLCTGRIFTSAKYYGQLLGIKTPIIASNGSYIREKDEEKIIYKEILNEKSCIDIFNIIKDYDFNFYFNTDDTIISPKPYPKGYTYLEMSNELPEDMKIKLKVSTNIKDEIKNNKGKILKAICIGKDINCLKEAREKIEKLNDFEIVSSFSDNFEIMNKNVSKGKAVKVLANMYGIDREEIICIGDGENDLSMIEYAGLGVAMGNGPKFIQEKADYIADTNDNFGVAKIIEKFIL